MNSINPTLQINYNVYVDEDIYDMAATVRLTHNDLEYGIDLNLNKILAIEDTISADKEWKNVTQALQRMQNYKDMSHEDWVKSIVEETKQKGEKEKIDKDQASLLDTMWKKLHKSWTIPIGGPFVVDIEVGPLLDLKGSIDIQGKLKTKARNTIFVEAKGSTMATLSSPSIAIATGLAKINGDSNFYIEPAKSVSLGIKAKGSLDVGVMGKASISLIHKGVVHATGSFKGGLKLAGEIGFSWDSESAYSGDYSSYNALYTGVKDTKIKLEAFACAGVELGITPWKFLTAGAEWEIWQKELGSCYLFPHFSMPSLPTYDYSKEQWSNGNFNNHLVLQSLPTKNIPEFLLGPCKVGLKIFDKNGNPVRETDEREYRDDGTLVWQLFPLEIDLNGLTRGNTYRCYPVLRYHDWWQLGASPSYEFTVPNMMTLGITDWTIKAGEERHLTLNGGWGPYQIINGDETIAMASFQKTNDANEISYSNDVGPGGGGGSAWRDGLVSTEEMPKVYIKGINVGETTIQVKDMRSNETISIMVEVTDEPEDENNITVTPQQIDYGEVEAGSYNLLRYVTISNSSEQERTVTLKLDNYNFWSLNLVSSDGIGGGGRDQEIFTKKIQPGEQVLARLSFKPSNVGEYNCNLIVTSEELEGWKCTVPVKAKYVEDPSFHLSSNTVDVYVNDYSMVYILNGSGEYDIINDYFDIVEADINVPHVAHIPPLGDISGGKVDDATDSWYITGKKVGHAVLKLKDKKTNEVLTLNVEVKKAPSLSLSAQSVELGVGETDSSIEIKVGSGWYDISSDSPEIVTATRVYNDVSWVDGNGVAHRGLFVKIQGLKAGNAKVTVTDMSSGETAVIHVKVKGEELVSYLTCPDDHHPHLIDLGLPSGTKWACCNVGADKPESYGGYYAWGETTEKDVYNWSTYIHCDGSSSTCHNLGSDIAGTQYDVAHVQWGGSWVMPSYDQHVELRNNCTSEWTTLNGVNGRRFTGPNGGTIFLPALGYRGNGDFIVVGERGYYWSSTQDPVNSSDALDLRFDKNKVDRSEDDSRYFGQGVRSVSK